VRVLYLSIAWLDGNSSVEHFHVESACLLFVIAGSGLRLARRSPEDTEKAARITIRDWTWPFWLGLALILYWPAIHVGLLSDDFVIAERSAHFDLSPLGPQFFRPLPLALWGSILSAGGGPRTFHLLNIILHGTNAYFVTRIVADLVPDRVWPTIAGLIVLTLPLGPEAVSWCAGIFDVLATTIVCGAVLVARGYNGQSGNGRRAALLGLSLAGLLTKETAAVLPALVMLDIQARRAWSRKVAIDISLMVIAATIFAGLRLSSRGAESVRQPITRYLVQKWVFRPFGGLAVPWHIDVIHHTPWLAMLAAAIVIFVLTGFFIRTAGSPVRTGVAAAAAAWVLVAVIPTATTFLFVAPDLQGARYLYLPGVGWAALLVSTASDGWVRKLAARTVGLFALTVLVVISAAGVRLHLRNWTMAGAIRQQLEETAASNPAMRACHQLAVSDLPDSYRGAYIFRNGAVEAFQRDLGMTIVAVPRAGACSFRWRGDRFVPATVEVVAARE
jgi:hypothetical protein